MLPSQAATLRGVQRATPECGLILLAHVPKTGGSTVSEVLQALPGWLFLGRPKSGHPRFFATYGDVFEGTHAFRWPPKCLHLKPNVSALERGGCTGLPDWRRTRIMVDFHEPEGLHNFHASLMPRLPQLRARYAEAGCPMVVGTVLREPRAQMLSEFLYFRVALDRSLHGNATRQASTLVDKWLPQRANPQLAWLRGRSCRIHSGGIFLCSTPAADPCGASRADRGDDVAAEATVLAPALQLLRQLDIVGTTEEVPALVWAFAARVGVYFSGESSALDVRERSAADDVQAAAPMTAATDAMTRHAPRAPLLKCNPPMHAGMLHVESLDARAISLLERQSRCDRQLFKAAIRREAEVLDEMRNLHQRELIGTRFNASHLLQPFRSTFACRSSHGRQAKLG